MLEIYRLEARMMGKTMVPSKGKFNPDRNRSYWPVAVLIVAILSLICESGCVTAQNGFSQFYRDMMGANITNLPPHTGTTQIFATSDARNDSINLVRKGFVLVGESAFQGPSQGNGALMHQANKVGADVVLLSTSYLGSEQTEVPLVHYNPGQNLTTTSSGTVTANTWGSGGYGYGSGNYYGTSTTTSPGTYSTEYVPVTVERYQYDALFFRKNRRPVCGAMFEPLPPDLRRTLQQNSGVVVAVVIDDTPAFKANVLEGDVILAINDEDVSSVEGCIQTLHRFAGQSIQIKIWRDGQNKTISVLLN